MKKWMITIIAAIMSMILLAGCSQSGESKPQGEAVAVTKLHEAVKEAYGEDYIPNQPLDDETFLNIMGVDSALCEEYIAEVPMISTNVDTFVAVRAKEGKAEEVKEALEAYRESLIADTMQYPMNQIKIQASKVLSYDNYVFFLMLGFLEPQQEEQEEAKVLKAYEEENQKGIDAIEKLLKN